MNATAAPVFDRNVRDRETAGVKVPPHSLEAERSLLGSLLLDNRSFDDVAVIVIEDDFYLPSHREIYKGIAELYNKDKPCDILTLTDHLTSLTRLEAAGGETYIYEIVNSTPSAANIKAYALIVKERSILRKILSASSDITSLAYNTEGKDSRDLLNEVEQKIFNISDQRDSGNGMSKIADVLVGATDKIDKLFHQGDAITGTPTGFDDLDKMTAGLHPGDLVIIAGRPSMGKTTLVMNMAEHAAISAKKPIIVFSLEMSSESLVMRMLSSLGRINQNKIRTGKLTDEDWPRLTSAVSMLADAPIYIDETPALSPAEMRSKVRRIIRKEGEIGMIVVDYLQLMQVPTIKDNRTLEISEISRSLKMIAKEAKAPVVAGSQLNRGLEQRQDKRPIMSDLRESGAIEQDADLICFIYRDEVYNPDTEHKGVAEIIIGKQRNGEIGKIKLTFLGQYTRFENHAKEMF
ncbi:MAG: replicative DNA helicase [Legionellales bacterium]|jgi:replicative DNA helicase|nr:replicative DNA helicase [Legionellales bacterium]